MTKKEEFLNVLNHPEKVKVSKSVILACEANLKAFDEAYKRTDLTKRLEFAVSASAYLFGKGLEIEILKNIRPEEKSIWIVPAEVEEGITFDLPKHLEDDVIDLMDPFESACEEIIKNNYNLNIHNFWMLCQIYGSIYAEENKVWEHTVGGVSNDKVLTNNELYRFGLQAFKNEIETHGFKFIQASPNCVEPSNVLLEKNGVKYLVCLSTTILPKEGYIAKWRLEKVKVDAGRQDAIPCGTHIGLIPSNELLASEGIAIKEGEYKVQIRKLVNLLTGETISD